MEEQRKHQVFICQGTTSPPSFSTGKKTEEKPGSAITMSTLENLVMQRKLETNVCFFTRRHQCVKLVNVVTETSACL